MMSKFERYTATPQQAAHILGLVNEIDVRAALPSVQAPTLVVHAKDDPMVPVAMGRYLAEHLPNCERYLELDRDFHASWLSEDTDLLVDAAEQFLTGTIASTPVTAERVLATVLFTDIVDSTARARDIGDVEWRRLLDQHDDACLAEVSRHKGRVVKTTGDGVLAVFDGPARAVRCAQEILRRVQAMGLAVRAGIHVGECEQRADDISGIAVNIAARVMHEAADNELLVTRTVKDLSLGSDLTFTSHGSRELKGVPDLIDVYTVG
jgi:class 3 adenylate cyclase